MAAQNQMHNLTTLIKRLEAATSRLEDIASSTELPKDVSGLAQPATPQSETAATPLPPAPAPKEPQEVLPESIEDFDVFLNTSLDKYIKLSSQLGGVVAQQASEVLRGFQEQRKFLLIASKAAKPSTSGSSLTIYQNLLKPINDAVMAATELKESNRPDPMYSNLSAVADGIMVMGWVTIDRRPYTFVEESLGAAQFFGNRVLKEQKDNDPKQVEWVQSFYQIFHDLGDYIKQHHASGVAWNPRGEPAEEVAKALNASKASQQPPQSSTPSAGAPPPPPPPPPPGPAPILDIPVESAKAASAAPAGGFGAVFSELNKGESVTKGLRKVDKSEMTHKNPSLRTGSTVSEAPRAKSPVPGKKPKPESMRVKKPASKVLEANKWTIENYEKEAEPVEIDASITHSVLISRCNNTTVIIKGKANQVTVENSTRLSLVVDSLVSTVDVVKANNFALQVLGTVPTVMLDQIDSAQIYLSKESIATKLFTSKSDGINVNILAGGPDDDYKEVPLPSQICSYYSEEKGELVSEIVAHAG